GPKTTLWDVRGLVGFDERWLRERGVHGRPLARALAVSGRHHAIRMAGAIAGSRADRVPRRLRGRLSLAGRDTFEPVDVPASPLLEAREGTKSVDVNPGWAWEFVRRSHPSRPVASEPHDGRSEGPLTVAWIVPPWKVGSGGHTTIFRLIEQLERRGHACAIFLFDPLRREKRTAGELRREIVERFIAVRAPVFKGLDDFRGADVA